MTLLKEKCLNFFFLENKSVINANYLLFCLLSAFLGNVPCFILHLWPGLSFPLVTLSCLETLYKILVMTAVIHVIWMNRGLHLSVSALCLLFLRLVSKTILDS